MKDATPVNVLRAKNPFANVTHLRYNNKNREGGGIDGKDRYDKGKDRAESKGGG